ncbi:SDR family oxidoreductase, partial [Vibrio parahaemolyticus]
MKVLVTGGTGRIGKELVGELQKRGAPVRILTRDQDAKGVPAGVEVAVGDLTNPDTVREALKGVDQMFLLIGNVADELTQAL